MKKDYGSKKKKKYMQYLERKKRKEHNYVEMNKIDSYWTKYDGSREKILHHIKLYDGTVIKACYPNAYSWNTWIWCEHNKKVNARDKYNDSEVEFIHPLSSFGSLSMRYYDYKKYLEQKAK